MIDLHLHSTFSDGTCSPTELVETATKRGLHGISVTDHDTAAGTQEAMVAGDRLGITVISGIELSTFLGEQHFHVLGYDFDQHEKAFRAVRERLQASRAERNIEIIKKLNGLGIEIAMDELRTVSARGQTGRPHIARLLVAKGVVTTINQAFTHYLKKGASAYAARYVCPVKQALDLVHGAGGVVVLAHPVQIGNSMVDLDNLLKKMKEIGLDGLETYYPTQKGALRKKLRLLAQKHDLLETGGSDYHGDIRAGTSLAGGKGLRIPSILLEKLMNRNNKRTKIE